MLATRRSNVAQSDRPARVVHAIPGRLRLRLEGREWTAASIDALGSRLDELRRLDGVREVRLNPGARSLVIRYEQTLLSGDELLEPMAAAGIRVIVEEPAEASPRLPLRFDRRTVRALAISGVSLYGARQVGAAFGGAATWPAYFVIWFGLRQLETRLAPRDEAPPS